MSFGTALKSGLASKFKDVIGNNEHAVIVVWDYRSEKSENSGAKSMMRQISKKVLSKGIEDAERKSVAGKARSYQVQFNPSSLHITAHSDTNLHASITSGLENAAGGTKAGLLENAAAQIPAITQAGTNSAKGIQNIAGTSLSPMVDFQVTLIFDKVNNADSFIGDKYSTFTSAQAISNAATIATKAVSKANGKNVPWTVQPIVEAFIAAIHSPETRTMTFLWNEFEFNGVLKNINAEYTMFSTSGRPVRAQLGLHLRQEANSTNKMNWQKSFEEAFAEGDEIDFNRVFD